MTAISPITIVQCFTYNTLWAVNPNADAIHFRAKPGLRMEADQLARVEVARIIKRMRLSGLGAAQVRRIVMPIILAPTSYSDHVGAKLRRIARTDIQSAAARGAA